MNGRQLLWLVDALLACSPAEEAIMTAEQFFKISIEGQNLGKYVERWDAAYSRLHCRVPDDTILFMQFRQNVERVEDFASDYKE